MARYAAFGKIPALGDFVRIAASPSFVDPWDHWLQDALLAGKAAFGPDWQECYLSAPIWRFALSPGLAGPHGMLGVMMPSVDRVGRQFPLTLFTVAGADAAATHAANSDLFAALEEVALDALSDDMDKADLAGSLATLPPPQHVQDPVVSPCQSHWSALLGDRLRTVAFPGLPSPQESVGFFGPLPTARPTAPSEEPMT